MANVQQFFIKMFSDNIWYISFEETINFIEVCVANVMPQMKQFKNANEGVSNILNNKVFHLLICLVTWYASSFSWVYSSSEFFRKTFFIGS